jgi:hypothetical protein
MPDHRPFAPVYAALCAVVDELREQLALCPRCRAGRCVEAHVRLRQRMADLDAARAESLKAVVNA